MEKEYSYKYLQINRGKRVVFESSETPFGSVRPELSDMGMSSGLASELRTNFPVLSFSSACITDGAILIQDISKSKTAKFNI